MVVNTQVLVFMLKYMKQRSKYMHIEYAEDKELIELAAKAAGLPERGWMGPAFMYVKDNQFTDWNPLKDDGDAFRLAVKLSLTIIQDKNDKLCAVHWTDVQGCRSAYKEDPCAATRKAITRAAAEIGRNMK